MLWDPFLIKKLLKSVICRIVNSTQIYYSSLIKSTITGWKKKKKKKTQLQNVDARTSKRSQNPRRNNNETFMNLLIWGCTHVSTWPTVTDQNKTKLVYNYVPPLHMVLLVCYARKNRTQAVSSYIQLFVMLANFHFKNQKGFSEIASFHVF